MSIDKSSPLYDKIKSVLGTDAEVEALNGLLEEKQEVNSEKRSRQNGKRVQRHQQEAEEEHSQKVDVKEKVLTKTFSANDRIQAKQRLVGVTPLDDLSDNEDIDEDGLTPAERDVEGVQSTIEKYVFNPPRDKILQATELYGSEISNFAAALMQEHATEPWKPGKESSLKFYINTFCILRRSHKRRLLQEGVTALQPQNNSEFGFGDRSNF